MFKVFFLTPEKRDSQRVVHLNGKKIVAFSTFDKKINFIDLRNNQERVSPIQGHAGTIKCLYISESKGTIVTGSFDTSIRFLFN